jgi:hypothetical protein
MSSLLAGVVLLVAFALVEALAGRVGPRGGAIARGGLFLALGAVATEFARFDHGRPEWLFAIGFVAAPVVVIFGGAAWGVRRWYGFPDLGPLPGRLALAAGGLVAGMLVGQQVKVADVRASEERGVEIWAKVRAHRAARGGEWPARLSDAVPDAPPSRMGAVAPPPYRYDPAKRTLSFPVRTGAERVLDLAAESPSWRGP